MSHILQVTASSLLSASCLPVHNHPGRMAMTYQDSNSKVCTKCGDTKSLDEFGPHNLAADGKKTRCNKCNNKARSAYIKTKNGLITKIYGEQNQKSKRRNHPQPGYSLPELRTWALAKPVFHELYDAWVSSDYEKMQVPSCDRLDDYLPYTLDNLRVVTWQENFDKGHADRKNGINNKQSKAVVQLTKEGEFIADHYSANQASRVTGLSQGTISACCRGEKNHTGGFRWRFKNPQD